MSLPQFKDENDFRVNWIRPLLSKLGYLMVTHSHGPDEHGKDHYFAEVDRLGCLRFYAIQAKRGDVRANTELRNLFTQIETAFEVPIVHNGQHHHVSAVYVMTDGKIRPLAQARMAAWRKKKQFGENVFFLGSEQLEVIEQRSNYIRDEEKRRVLMAVWRECNFNHRVLCTAELSTTGIHRRSIRRCFTNATQHAIATLDDFGFASELEKLLYALTALNGLIDLAISGSARFDRALGVDIGEAATEARGLLKDALAKIVEELMALERSRTIEVTVDSVDKIDG